MNIEKLDEKRVLFDLCLEDMKLLSIEYNSLNAKSSYNRKIINSLIDIAKIKTGTLHTRYFCRGYALRRRLLYTDYH